MTKNNKSVLFLGGKVCVSMAHRVQTHRHSSSWAQIRSRLQIPTLQSSIWLESCQTLEEQLEKNYKTINFCFWIYICVHLIFS